MRITSEGQITIPAEVREKLGFFPGTEIVFEPKEIYCACTEQERAGNRESLLFQKCGAEPLPA